jgi:NADH-quinone oxidoreductase subunit H
MVEQFLIIFFSFIFFIFQIFYLAIFEVLNFLIWIFNVFLLYFIIPILLSIAYFTLIERKVIATLQRRKGPNVVGIGGLLQPFSDGLKLFTKEIIIPRQSNRFLFLLSPIFFFFISLIGWVVIPIDNYYCFISDIKYSLLFVLSASSLSVYGIIIGGWSSNSKYAFLGAIRSISQLISYELILTFILLSVCLVSESINLIEIIESQRFQWHLWELFPLFIISIFICLAETNRHPFDLSEAESELVSGFNVEYSGVGFVLFFLGEYSNMLLISSLLVCCFLGGCYSPFSNSINSGGSFWFGLKLSIFILIFSISRTILPRYRYDYLMKLSWEFFLPLIIFLFIFFVIKKGIILFYVL